MIEFSVRPEMIEKIKENLKTYPLNQLSGKPQLEVVVYKSSKNDLKYLRIPDWWDMASMPDAEIIAMRKPWSWEIIASREKQRALLIYSAD